MIVQIMKTALNFLWWIFWSCVGFALASLTQKVSPWYLWLVVALGPTLVIESLIYWLILKFFFRSRNSIFWTIAMAAAVFAGFWILVAIDFSLNVKKMR